ncbi:MAG: nucleotidyltransferase family protein [Succinivibrio sp.]|nr:nucleotidyltransferase family protein [Succinivibrio sp.]
MTDWHAAVVPPQATLRETLDHINRGAIRMALITDADNKLLGIITDGDVRRVLIDGKPLTTAVGTIMNSAPLTGSRDTPRSDLIRLMRQRKQIVLPITDEQGHLLDVLSLDRDFYPERLSNAALLMCGGLGTRLRPLTETCPKPLLKVGNKPILETILESLIDVGFSTFYLSVRYMADMIRDYMKDGSQYGVNIRYVEEKEPLGTAGALGLLPEQPEDDLLIMNGDLLTKMDFLDFIKTHHNSGALATMAVREYTYQVPYGVVNFDGEKITGLSEKPSYSYLVNAGIYMLSPQVIKELRREEPHYLDMPTLFNELIEGGEKTTVYPLREYWLDIGRMDDFQRAQSGYAENFGVQS